MCGAVRSYGELILIIWLLVQVLLEQNGGADVRFHIQIRRSEDTQASLLGPGCCHGSYCKPVRIGSEEHMKDTVDDAEEI